MGTVGAFEAKTHLAALLDRVAKGEKITITRHGISGSHAGSRGGKRSQAVAPGNRGWPARLAATGEARRDERQGHD